MSELSVFATPEALADAALALVAARAQQCVQTSGRFTLALSGGSTPRLLYQRLAQHPELPWHAMQLFFGDERAVPPGHRDSNARMVEEALTHCSFVPRENVHRILAELSAHEAAAAYERTLRLYFDGPLPRFDLVLNGLGPDGHTASLFPHSSALDESERWVVAHWVEAQRSDRITLTFPVLNNAAETLFLVAGKEKAWALAEVLQGSASVADIPARGVRPTNGTLRFFADASAAGQLR